MVVRHVNSDDEFAILFNEVAGLHVVDFFATWCGPCQQIAPFFEQLSTKYPQAAFTKVDVDKCQNTASGQGVTAMPTFMFYLNKSKVDTLRGANPAELESKIKKWSSAAGESGSSAESEVPGQIDLIGFITKNACECLNESDGHNFKNFISSSGSSFVESDCDEQLIISIPFNQPVKLHSIKIKGPADYAPKTVKLFLNLPVTPDFDQAARSNSVQTLDLTPKQVEEGEIINLFYVKFQDVKNITMFVADNQGNKNVTRISRLQFYGTPIGMTNMQDFKRVAGKAGEAH